jgi:hypothetical protein
LSREYEILETLADDLANPDTVISLFNERELVESLLAIEEV